MIGYVKHFYSNKTLRLLKVFENFKAKSFKVIDNKLLK